MHLQLADLIINELPKVIKQFDTRLVVISDLLDIFIHDPSVDGKEGIYLIKEIVSAIRKISMSSSSPGQILSVVSWNNHQPSYNDILLSKLDKRIEFTHCTSSRGKRLSSSLLSPSSVKVKFTNNKDVKYNSYTNNNKCNYLLPIRDLCLNQQRK
jgi:hypothetical protein